MDVAIKLDKMKPRMSDKEEFLEGKTKIELQFDMKDDKNKYLDLKHSGN